MASISDTTEEKTGGAPLIPPVTRLPRVTSARLTRPSIGWFDPREVQIERRGFEGRPGSPKLASACANRALALVQLLLGDGALSSAANAGQFDARELERGLVGLTSAAARSYSACRAADR